MPMIKEMTTNLAARLVLVNSIPMDLVIPKDDWFPPMVFIWCLVFSLIVAYSFGIRWVPFGILMRFVIRRRPVSCDAGQLRF